MQTQKLFSWKLIKFFWLIFKSQISIKVCAHLYIYIWLNIYLKYFASQTK